MYVNFPKSFFFLEFVYVSARIVSLLCEIIAGNHNINFTRKVFSLSTRSVYNIKGLSLSSLVHKFNAKSLCFSDLFCCVDMFEWLCLLVFEYKQDEIVAKKKTYIWRAMYTCFFYWRNVYINLLFHMHWNIVYTCYVMRVLFSLFLLFFLNNKCLFHDRT